MVKSRCVISMLLAKLDIINAELSMKYDRNIIVQTSGRIKAPESIRAKLRKKGYEETYDMAQEKINDIVGVRAVCSFMDDLYLVAKALEQHRDVRTVKVKDYLQEPKRSGYRSLHLIVEVPIYFQGEELWRRAEIQLRTAAMDFWAGLDHQLIYKRGLKEAKLIGQELYEYAQIVEELEQKMVELRDRIAAI